MKAPPSTYSLQQLQDMYYEESVKKEVMSGVATVYTARHSGGIEGYHINPIGTNSVRYAANRSQLNKFIKSLIK